MEHLGKILKRKEFQVNTYNTDRLDIRTESKEIAEKPNNKLTLTRGALNIADKTIQMNFQLKVIVTDTPAPGGRSCRFTTWT